jgi:hypothetical protein
MNGSLNLKEGIGKEWNVLSTRKKQRIEASKL